MSDVGFPGLEWVVDVIFAIGVVGPPLLIGLILLLIGWLVRDRKGILTTFYFVLSISGVFAVLWWYSVWLNDSDILWWALPVAIFSTIFVFGLFRLLRWILKRKTQSGAGK